MTHKCMMPNCITSLPDIGEVIVKASELERLRARSKKLAKLEAHGVDNWMGYDDAMQELHGGEDD